MAELIKHENNTAELRFNITWDEFEAAVNRAFNKNKKKFRIPGFRAGKVPRAIIEKHYGEGVFYEDAINDILPDTYPKAVEELELTPVDRPEIDIETLEKGQDVVIKAVVTTKPEVELGEYKGVEVSVIKDAVTDEMVDNALVQEQKMNARMVAVEDRAVENGDTVIIDYKGSVDGEYFEGGTAENHSLEIGSGQFIPGFEEQLVGKNSGETVDVNVTFPEEYHADHLAGKDAKFEVVIHEIKMQELPEIDDDFIMDISEFDTVDEYKADKKKQMEEEAEKAYEHKVRDAVIEKVCDNALIDIPETMVDQETDRMIQDFDYQLRYQGMDLDTYLHYTNGSREDLKEQMKNDAEMRVKTSLVIEAIAAAEGIEATQEDIDAELEQIAEAQKRELEEIKKIYAYDDFGMIKDTLVSRKTVDFMVENANVK